MSNWKPCILARADPAGAFFENRGAILWWENPFVIGLLFVVAYTFCDWLFRGYRRGR